ncbi:MAG: glycosyltransferase [Candidatus Methylomirabilales bacterium]
MAGTARIGRDHAETPLLDVVVIFDSARNPSDRVVLAHPNTDLVDKVCLELSVIVPTLNESDNIVALIDKLDSVLSGIEWEVIFVDDDSIDGTADLVRKIGATNRRVRCVHRIDRRGLSSACMEGMLASSAPYLAVMDADMQHDEALLPRMLQALKHGETDIVIGSRYVEGGGIGKLETSRQIISRVAGRMSRWVMKAEVSDPMSGFFMLGCDVFHSTVRKLSGIGFKILFDILVSSPRRLRVRELPYEFRTRQAGVSKLDTAVAWEYGILLLDKMIGHIVPVRFILFSMVGLLGLAVHLSALAIVFQLIKLNFEISQALATLVAMTSNYLVNNLFTYRDIRLRGSALFRGLMSFYAVCSVGALANIGVASYVYGTGAEWWVAGLAGAIVGAIWNYAVSSVYTWRVPRRA